MQASMENKDSIQSNNNLSGYFKNITTVSRQLLAGLQLSWQHFKRATYRRTPSNVESDNYFQQPDGLVSIQYPHEKIPVPVVGRYRLFMEADDCIVCDQCVRICPVNCIKIEKVKAIDVIGTTSDGSKKRFYLPTFDIDMAKCCFCGLCTIVCPTECLTMTPEYDYSETNRENFIYHFGNISPEEAQQKQQELLEFEAAKKAAKAAAIAAETNP